ncbi:hypothetical protein HELRODRAFT_183676 [Helobdella robusta]|uniref:Uncharacterized protein n=1 Tax=Helobdella robusta TaxID=6412 RepID=T1FK09_HELRO|nr:hypothetical protein HELRODRAFT_183676 [Helobdella robusta]ESO10398.1 hypothetical protein HELRODRAFT_183676 [Helobdella robusta]
MTSFHIRGRPLINKLQKISRRTITEYTYNTNGTDEDTGDSSIDQTAIKGRVKDTNKISTIKHNTKVISPISTTDRQNPTTEQEQQLGSPVKETGLTSEAASSNQCLFWSLRDLTRDSMLIGICCSDSCCLVLVVRKPIRLDGPVKTGRGCAKADRLTDRPSENRPLVVRKPIRLDGPVKTGQGCAKADRLTDRPSENRPLVVRKPIRLDGPVKTGQGCAKADRLTDRPSENRPLVVRKPIRLDGPVKTGQGCAKADRPTDRQAQ